MPKPVSLRIPDDVRKAIEEQARCERRAFSSVANEMLAEAVKMQRIPGIVFATEAAGRRARIAGTGIDVWHVVQTCKAVGGDWDELRGAFHWLGEDQIRSALAFYEAFPDEIDDWMRAEAEMTPERVWEMYPSMRPAWR